MKKIFLTAVTLCLCATSATALFAADNNKEPHVAGYVTNPFKANWELQGGIGPTFTLRNGSGIENGTSIGAHVGAIKWVHPVFGIRLDVEAGEYAQMFKKGYDVNFEYYGQKKAWNYFYIHPDFMINLSNWIGGYKERIYNAILYIGGGYALGNMNTSGDTMSEEFLANVGLQNRFYVSNAVSIDLQAQFDLGKTRFYPFGSLNSTHFYGLKVMVGATYRFNDRNFYRSGGTVDEFNALNDAINTYKNQAANALEDRDAMGKKLDMANAEAKRLADALAAEQAKPKAVAKRAQAANAKEAVDTDNYDEILFYTIGSAELTDYNKKRLDLVAEHIKADEDGKVFKIDGFADPETGSAKLNSKLAEKRAKTVYDYLLSKGVPEEKMQYTNCATSNLPFGKPLHNRIVVIY